MEDETSTLDHLQKTEGLETYVVDDQCIIYDTSADRIHYLNPTAALVLEFCDGTRSSAEIAIIVQQAYRLPEAPLDEVIRCLSSLKEMQIVR